MKRFLGLGLLLMVILGSCKRETRTLKEIEDEQIFINVDNLDAGLYRVLLVADDKIYSKNLLKTN